MKKIAFSLCLALVLLLTSREVHAAPAFTSLGFESGGQVAALPGVAPNTLVLAWSEESGTFVGEWSLSERRMLQRKKVRGYDYATSTKLARSGERFVLLTAGFGSSEAKLETIVFDGKLVEQRSTSFAAEGASPSLAADERTIAIATFEENEPVVPPIVTSRVRWAPQHALHVRVLDAATLEVRGARVFRGQTLLRPQLVQDRAEHALAFVSGRLFVAVPDKEPTIVEVAVPSLSTIKQRKLPRPEEPAIAPTSASIVRAGDELVVGTHDAIRVLTLALDIRVQNKKTRGAFVCAVDASTGALLSDRALPFAAIGGHAVKNIDAAYEDDAPPTLLWAAGKPIVIATMPGDTKKGIAVGR